ncbi:putative 3-mercaptopyruvate sulfurtransferase [Thiomonas sp. X19]|uniref:sulfurtransferase n=1 Tax=Thiomonas sp. X19 TaxID=1050370 RepID=UPI000B6C4EE9|nr:sulfurtransferase [Thiomonas sp. X19]SCC93287.1 putative 3-mercaptopyruvate sulfurtransferase [Thiomonas sp. X19]
MTASRETNHQAARYTTLISAAQLQQALAGVFVADCSHELSDPGAGERDYASGHIPGAIHVHLDRDLASLPNGSNGRHPLPDRAALADLLARHGLRSGQQVVAYDRAQGPYAARLWWLLRWLGHDQVAVLDGGWQSWGAAGGAVQTTSPAPLPRGDFSLRPSLAQFVQVDDLVANLRHRQRLLVDARSLQRYGGDGETLDPKAGHIPGAVCRFFRDNLGDDGRFKPAQDLRTEWLALLGKRKPHEIVNQCGSGVSACHNILALEHAGLGGSALYPGSWSEWCADPDRPMVRGTEP